MTLQATDGGTISREFDALEFGRLTWIGLFVAAIGWAIMIGEATVADVLSPKLGRPLTPTFHTDLFEIAKCIIGSGFALAVVGALQTGFGALNRFFEAVLMRSARRSAPDPVVPPDETPVERRPYRLLPDGSVEVETILGTRRFKSMAEARDFI